MRKGISLGKSKTVDLTVGSPAKQILMFFLPLLAGNVFQQLYSLVDSIVVGKGIGGDALAAIGATGSINFFVIGFASGLCSGFGVTMAHEFGAGNIEKLRKVVAMSIILCAAISIVFTFASEISVESVLHLMNTDLEIFQDSLRYIRIMYGGVVITVTYNISAALLRSLGDSKTPFTAIVIAALMNVVLDLFFVLVLGWGVAGAAWATLISQFFSCAFCLVRIGGLPEIVLTKEHFRIDWKLCGYLLRIGVPVAFMSSVTAIGTIVIQYFVNAFGKLYISAFSAASKITNLIMQPGGTLGTAMATYVGQNLGAGKFDRISKGVKIAALYSFLMCAVLGTIVFLFPTQLVGLMISEPEIIALTPQYLRISGPFIIPLGMLFLFRNSCIGLGRTFVTMLTGFMELGVRAVVLILFTKSWGFVTVPLAEAIAWVLTALMIFADFLYGMHKLRKRQNM